MIKKLKKKQEPKIPKDAYRLLNGNCVVRRGQVISVRRDTPDLDKLARAFLAVAEQQNGKNDR
jgi:hypothetical protein